MKDITKLIRRFVGILLLSTVLVIVLNIIILATISASQTANGRPWTTAKETAEALQETETGYVLSSDMTERLSGENAWAIYIDNDTLEVKWHTENLPDTVPLHYTISDIASLTRGYIDGYPTYTGECENGLVVVGYPKDRYWKHMSPSWDYDFIKNAPYTVLVVIGVNIFLIFLTFVNFLRSVFQKSLDIPGQSVMIYFCQFQAAEIRQTDYQWYTSAAFRRACLCQGKRTFI